MRFLLLALLVACGGSKEPRPLDPENLPDTRTRLETQPAGDVLAGDWFVCDDACENLRRIYERGGVRFADGRIYELIPVEIAGRDEGFDRLCVGEEIGFYELRHGGRRVLFAIQGSNPQDLLLTFTNGNRSVRVGGPFGRALFLERTGVRGQTCAGDDF